MTKNPEFDRSKLSASELTEFAESASAGTVSVIVEAAVPPVAFAWKTPRDESSRPRPVSVEPADDEVDTAIMDRLERELSDVGVAHLVRLATAQAFAAEVTAVQLQAITALPSVDRIRPNRTHHLR